MNWNDPHVKLSLKEWQELLDWRGRDSRLVRAAFAWSRRKKAFLAQLKNWRRRLPRPQDPLRVLFWLPGGLGDAACAKRLVMAYRTYLPQAVFDVYAPLPGVGETLFGADEKTNVLTQDDFYTADYDLAVQACLAAKFLHVNEERLRRNAPDFLPVLQRAQQAQAALGTLLDDLFLTEGVLGRWLYAQGGRRFDLMAYTAGTELPHDAFAQLSVMDHARKKWGLEGVSYLTFHDGTSLAQTVSRQRPTRAWPAVRWCEFFRLFKQAFPHIKLVQLGGQNSPVYEEADVCLVGKTRVQELPSILQGALAHVDTESGLVHLAQFLDVRSVVIFGPSSAHFFGYAKNENLAAGPCGGCMWVSNDWMLKCPLGAVAAPCTQAVSAQSVLDAVKRILKH